MNSSGYADMRASSFVFAPVRGRNRAKSFELVPGSRAGISMEMKRASLILTDVQFCAWVATAVPGDTLEYHRGFLGADRTPQGQPMNTDDRATLIRTSNHAFRLAEQGLIHLVQRRLAPRTFSYLAIARQNPRNAPLSFPNLVEAA